eukprot:c28944_g6_i1 orf=2-202(-)
MLPIIPTRAYPLPEVVKAVGIPYDNFSLNNLGDELSGSMTIQAHPKVLDYAERCSRGGVYEPKSNGQ